MFEYNIIVEEDKEAKEATGDDLYNVILNNFAACKGLTLRQTMKLRIEDIIDAAIINMKEDIEK